MSRSPLARSFAALLALWLLVFTTGPSALHACPMHDGAVAATEGHGAPDAPAGHHGHGAPDVAAGQHGQGDASAPEAAHVCTCPGRCCTVAPVLLPRVDAEVAAVVTAMRDPGLPDHVYVPVHRSLLLPFANGPPRA